LANDATNPQYFLREESGIRSARVLSGRGVVYPGYRLVGQGKSAPSEGLQSVNIVKMVSPLTGQGSAAPGGGWRYANRNAQTLNVRRLRVQRSVAPTQFGGNTRVVRPPRTAIRRMTGAGQGVVGYV
jgi:hypothetical protein